ncbi:MAG: cob(I)yrinic acid a,c-diamide adenosyltransferase [Dehalococcoidia bacterium]
MSDQNAPSMRLYGRHVLICGHGTCAPGELAGQLEAAFRGELGDRRRLRNPERVKISIADCLGVCANGPIVAVYPEGVWYHHVDAELARRIAREHLVDGRPVHEAVFHDLYPANASVPYAPAVRSDAGTYIPEGTVEGVEEEPRGGTPVSDETGEAEREARRQQARRTNVKKGLVIVNTGDGKGKTTAAIGLVTRAWGRNLRTSVVQFIKHSGANYGEVRAAKRMGVPWIGSGDGWTWTSKDLDESAELARHGWKLAQERIASGDLDVLVLDEFTYALHFGWLDTGEVIEWLRLNKPPMMHLIITGRNAPPALVEYADLVTEMRSIKHPYDTQGIRAQPGVEF